MNMYINKGVKINNIKEARYKHKEIYGEKSCGYWAIARRFDRGWSIKDIINTPSRGWGGKRR